MLCSVLREFNRPWVLEERPDPVPGEGQVAIRVHASGMCGTDIHLSHGFLDASVPLIPGHEAVGEVAALGPGVTDLVVGDRVGVSWVQRGCGRCTWCQKGAPVYCAAPQTWMEIGGGHCEIMVAWSEGCTLLPSGLDFETAAPMFCAGITVVSGLRNANVLPGERVAVLGFGGLGHLAIQVAKAWGLETVALTSSDEKADDARALGADDAIVVDSDPGQALAQVGGADVVLCTSNSARQVSQMISGLRPEGRIVNAGVLDGPLVINSVDLLTIQGKICGVVQNSRRDLVDTLALAASGKLRPVLEVYELADHNEVLARLERGNVRYRAVLLPTK